MGKSLVIINQDSGYLMIDMANAFVAKGFDVHLITGRLVERNHSLDEKVKITKILKYQRDSTVKRLSTWLIGFLQIFFQVLIKHRHKNLLLVSNPPFATLLPLFIKNPFSLLIYDVYPDALIEYQILKENSIIVQQWKKSNIKIFKKAKRIYTLNESMKQVLLKYDAGEKIKVVPIWTDNTFLKPIPKTENSFIKELGLEGKFIVQYSGNLGKTHPIEKLLDVAQIIPEETYTFVIIGGGEKFKSIEAGIKERKLTNVRLLPWQPVEKLPMTLAAADVGVVTLGKEASNLSIPSKTYNLMSVGVPILSVCNHSSALASLVTKNNIGNNFEEDEILKMADFIKELKENKDSRAYFKNNSLKLSKKFTPENAYKFDC